MGLSRRIARLERGTDTVTGEHTITIYWRSPQVPRGDFSALRRAQDAGAIPIAERPDVRRFDTKDHADRAFKQFEAEMHE